MKKIIIFILTFILFIGSVEAISFKMGSYIPNGYIKMVKDGKSRYLQINFIYDQDGRVVYCIEPFVLIETSGTNYEAYYSNYANHTKLSEAQWQRVMLLSYYGYGYGNHTDAKWYGITQYMIWKTVDTENDIYFTNKLNGSRVEKYASEMQELENLITAHKIKPAFNNNLTINYKEKLVLEDSNKVLNNFQLRNYSNLKVTKSENNLIIEANNCSNNQKISLIKEDNYYNKPVVVYIHDSAQNTVGVGSYEMFSYDLTVNVTCSKINLDIKDISTVYSSQKKFLVKYGIYDGNNNLVETVTTDKPGEFHSSMLPIGDYYVRQIESGLGYVRDNATYHIKLQNDKLEKLQLNNDAIKNKIKLTKYYGKKDGTIYEEEKGANFDVIDINGNKVATLLTNDLGKASIELGYGEYTIKQINGLENYLFAEDINVLVIENGKEQTFDIYNYLETFKLKIRLVDEDKNVIKENTTIKIDDIYNIEGGEIILDLPYGQYEILVDDILGYEPIGKRKMIFDVDTPFVKENGDDVYIFDIILKQVEESIEEETNNDVVIIPSTNNQVIEEPKLETGEILQGGQIVIENPNTAADFSWKAIIWLLGILNFMCILTKFVQNKE